MADQERSELSCSFYCEPLRTWIKAIVNKFAILNFQLDTQALRSYLKLSYENELHVWPKYKS